jgi:hypothetical protein
MNSEFFRKKVLPTGLAIGVGISALSGCAVANPGKDPGKEPTKPSTEQSGELPNQSTIESDKVADSEVADETDFSGTEDEATPEEYFITEEFPDGWTGTKIKEVHKVVFGYNFPDGGLEKIVVPNDIDGMSLSGGGQGNYHEYRSGVKEVQFQKGSNLKFLKFHCDAVELTLPDTCEEVRLDDIGDDFQLTLGRDTRLLYVNLQGTNGGVIDATKANLQEVKFSSQADVVIKAKDEDTAIAIAQNGLEVSAGDDSEVGWRENISIQVGNNEPRVWYEYSPDIAALG